MKYKLMSLLAGASALMVSGMASSVGFSYTGPNSSVNFADPACNTFFVMDQSGTITCSGALPPQPTIPTCSINPASPSFTQNGAGVSLSANCQNSPTTFQWTLDGQQVSTASTYAPPVSLSVGQHAVVLAGTNTAGTGTTSTTLTVTDPAVVPPPVTSCPQAITEQAVDFSMSGNTKHLKMNTGQAQAFKFTTGNLGRLGSLDTAQSTIGITVYRFMNVSEQRCDFSYSNYDSYNGCGSSGSFNASIQYKVGQGDRMVCSLKPNTTYYLNVRNENITPPTSRTPSQRGIDSCPVGKTCGFVFGLY